MTGSISVSIDATDSGGNVARQRQRQRGINPGHRVDLPLTLTVAGVGDLGAVPISAAPTWPPAIWRCRRPRRC